MTTKSEKSDGIPRNRGGRLARRARSFKEDLLEKIIQMRSPSSTRAASPHKPLSKLKTDQPAVVERRNSVGEHGSSTKIIPGDELQAYRKDIFSALRYFRDVIDKKTLMQLPGSASAILDSVLDFYMAYKGYLTNEQSSLLLSSNNQVYQSLANLVRWADMVMLHGEAAFEKESVSETLKNFESAIKGLFLLVQEKIKEKTACSSGFEPSSSHLSNGLVGHKMANMQENCMCGTKGQEENSSVDHSLPSRQQNTFQTTPFPSLVTLGHSVSSDSILSSTQHTLDDIDLPPPKPPLPSGREMLRPNGRLLSTSSVPDMLPPALPPKKRSQVNWCAPRSHLSHDSYYCQHTSTVCRPSRSSGEWESNRVVSGSDWSSSVGRSPASVSSLSASASSLDSTTNLSSDELLQTAPGDFRYDFDSAWKASSSTMFSYQCQTNHAMVRTQRRVQDVTCVEPCTPKITCLTSGTLCSHQNVMTNFIASSSTVTVCTLTSTDCTVKECVTSTHDTPPAIPPKQRSTAQRTPSQYDNVPDLNSDERDSMLPLLYAGSPISQHRLTTTSSVFDCNSSSSSSGIADCEPLPPPLPPKKKHVTAYMQVFGSCTEANSASYIRSLHGYGCGYVHQEMSSTLSFAKKAATFSLTSSSDDSVFSETLSAFEPLRCQDSIGNSPPPALPPKKGKVAGMTQGDFLTAVSRLPNDSEDSGYVVGENDLYTTNVIEPVDSTINEDSTPDVSHVSPAAPTSNVNVESDSFDPPCSKDVQVLDELDARPFLVYKKEGDDGPDIRGGTVFALVVHATLASRNEIAYQDAFMVTYRTFITPLELVNTLLYRYNKFSQAMEVVRQRTARSAFSLLVRVVGDFRVMDTDKDILQVLTDFVCQLLSSGELSLARALRKKTVEKWNDKVLSKQTSLAPLSSKGVSTKQATLLDFKSEQLAEQMTLLDADLFQEIEIADVLIWSRLQKEELSPNLTTFTEHFNKMSYWVRSRILEQDDAKDRERYVVKFIKIMKHLRKMNNFNSYLAILSALDSAPIRRLEWQKHITEGLKEYCELIDSTSSFRSYRQALAETEPPCIPYIGLILQDLTFVHIGNNDFLTDNVVNFSKRWQQFNILDMMRRFRKCQYNFKSCDRIIAFFNNFDDHLCEEAMWQISESIKPRGTKKKIDQGGQ